MGTEEGNGTWQWEVCNALAHESAERIVLMHQATVWAVRSASTWGRYYLVMAASQEARTLKVCAKPLRGSVPEALHSRLRHGLWARRLDCMYVNAPSLVAGIPHPSDEKSFLYEIEDVGVAEPCMGFRYRDSCRHIGETPLEQIMQEP